MLSIGQKKWIQNLGLTSNNLFYFLPIALIVGLSISPETRLVAVILLAGAALIILALRKIAFGIVAIFFSLFLPISFEFAGFHMIPADLTLLCCLTLFAVVRLVRGSLRLQLFPHHRLVTAFLLIAVVSLYNVQNKMGSIGDVLQLVEIYVLLGILLRNTLTDDLLRKISTVLILGIVLQAIPALPKLLEGERFWGWMGGNFPFVAALTFIIVLHLYLYGQAKVKFAALWLLAIIGTELLATGTRSAWLGVVGGSCIASFIKGKNAIFKGLAVALVVLLLIMGTGPPFLSGRLVSIFDTNYYSNVSRLYLLITAWKAFEENPFFGVGIKNFSNVQARYVPREALVNPEGNYRIAREVRLKAGAHNMYLSILAELGLIGFSVFAILFFLSLRHAWLNVRFSEDVYSRARNSCILSCLVSFYLMALFVPGIYLRTDYAVFFILILTSIQKFRQGELQLAHGRTG